MRGNIIWFCLLLFHLPVIGNTEIVCTAAEEKYITCKFPENLNSTQNDFGVNFYPDGGGEGKRNGFQKSKYSNRYKKITYCSAIFNHRAIEPLIDCGWIKQKLLCIAQQGFKTMEPVSDTAVFIIPISFAKRLGSYRCVTGNSNNIQPCRFSEHKDEDHFASCETYLPSQGNQVILACNFSAEVERFKIHQNEAVVASFTKSDCQSLTSCNYTLVDNHSIFTVKLDVSNHSSNEYSCRADDSSHQFKVKECTTTQGIHTKASDTRVFNIIIAVLQGVFLLTTLILILILHLRRRRRRLNQIMRAAARSNNQELNDVEVSFARQKRHNDFEKEELDTQFTKKLIARLPFAGSVSAMGKG